MCWADEDEKGKNDDVSNTREDHFLYEEARGTSFVILLRHSGFKMP